METSTDWAAKKEPWNYIGPKYREICELILKDDYPAAPNPSAPTVAENAQEGQGAQEAPKPLPQQLDLFDPPDTP